MVLSFYHTWSRKEKREKCFAFIRDVVLLVVWFDLICNLKKSRRRQIQIQREQQRVWERLIDREKENYLKKGRPDANQRAYFEGTISWVYTGLKRGWDKGSHTIKLSYQLCINLLLSSLHCAFKLQRLPRCSCNLLLFLFSETNNQLQTNWEFSGFSLRDEVERD